MTATITQVARHWMRQSELGKGARLNGDVMDLLNAHGVGELIQKLAAEEQRQLCNQRLTKTSTRGENTGSPTTDAETDRSERPSSRSSGMTPPRDASAAARRAQRTSSRRKTS